MNAKFKSIRRPFTLIIGTSVISLSLLLAGNTAFAAGPHDRDDGRPHQHQVQQHKSNNGSGKVDYHRVRPQEVKRPAPVGHLNARHDFKPVKFHHYEARPQARPSEYHHRMPAEYGRFVRHLPARHLSLWVGGTRYFYSAGIFLRLGPSGYIVVGAPIGAVVTELPVLRSTILVHGATYYYSDGAYYRRVPSGYVVVDDPA